MGEGGPPTTLSYRYKVGCRRKIRKISTLSGPQKAPLIAAYGRGSYIVRKLSPRPNNRLAGCMHVSLTVFRRFGRRGLALGDI